MRRLLLLALLPLGACDSGPAASPPDLLPLDVGHRWIFELTVRDAGGGTLSVRPDTVTVVGDTVLAGERWFVLAGASDDSQAGFGGLNAVREDGVWFRGGAEAPPFLQYAYPAEAGTSYPYSPYRYDAEATLVSTGDAGERYHYAVRFDRRKDVPLSFNEAVPPLRRVLRPGVGFETYETQWWVVGEDGDLVVRSVQTWRLVRFEPAGARS